MASAAQPASMKATVPFGGTVTDGNRVALTNFKSWFQTQDSTPTTALISPLSVATNTVQHLIVPLNATTLVIIPKTNPCQVSEISGTTSLTQYVEVPAGTMASFDVSRQKDVYLLGVTGSSVVNFYFQTI